MLTNVSLSFSDDVSVREYEYGTKNSEREKLVGVNFDNELIFENISLVFAEKLVGNLMQ